VLLNTHVRIAENPEVQGDLADNGEMRREKP